MRPDKRPASSLRRQGPITPASPYATFDHPSISRRCDPMYHVYFMASRRHGTLYIGVTNSVPRRIADHLAGKGSEFVRKYGVTRLVRVESYQRADEAITREKQLKRWKRDWKIRLIEEDNPDWNDLALLLGWFSDRSKGQG